MKRLSLVVLFFAFLMVTQAYAYDCYNITSSGAISDVGNYTYNGGAWTVGSTNNLTCVNKTFNITGDIQ